MPLDTFSVALAASIEVLVPTIRVSSEFILHPVRVMSAKGAASTKVLSLSFIAGGLIPSGWATGRSSRHRLHTGTCISALLFFERRLRCIRPGRLRCRLHVVVFPDDYQ